MTKKIIFIMGITSTILMSDTNVTAMGEDAIMKMMSSLKHTLKGAIKEGGMVNGANVCKDSAVAVEKDVNDKLNNINIRRVTTKPRNINNTPSKDELKVLNEFEKNNSKSTVTVKIDETHYKVYKPIYMGKKVCLACHGSEKTLNQKAYDVIKSNYKDDKAIGYKKGDFRGAFVADIILKP